MLLPESAKPATVSSEPVSNLEQLGGRLNDKDTRSLSDVQASRLGFAIAPIFQAAALIAVAAYAVSR